MTDFLSTFIFILPGIMAYFWLQLFGLTPSVKHTAAEISGIASLLWLPISFITILVLNLWGSFVKKGNFAVTQVWTIDEFNQSTTDLKYLFLFLCISFITSFLFCWIWSLWGNNLIRWGINKVRKSRKIANLSSSTSVWEEFFVKINDPEESVKQAVYMIHKIDKPDDYVIGSMTKASRPIELDKAIVLENTDEWKESITSEYDYKVSRVYIDTKSGMVVKEINYKKYTSKSHLRLEE